MPARFIFSLDCEGKWGVADQLHRDAHRTLSTERLREAYAGLLALLDRYDIAATFAFVGLFAEPAASVARLAGPLDDLAADFPEYLGPALADQRGGSRDGWTGDWAVDMVGSAKPAHEIAFHGATHVPWDRMDDRSLGKELALFGELSSPVAGSRTMVFPRNRVAHAERLPDIGIIGYRKGLNRSRLANLLAEFNPAPDPEQPMPASEPIAIPAGFFVNWQHGARRLVPRALGRGRVEHLLDRAKATGGIVHFWVHPENIASAPATLVRAEDILASAARARDNGHCIIQTQRDYCEGHVSSALPATAHGASA
jgi:hypothetical protein